MEEWRQQKRKIKLEAEQRLTEKIEKRRKEKVSFCYSMYLTRMNYSFNGMILFCDILIFIFYNVQFTRVKKPFPIHI